MSEPAMTTESTVYVTYIGSSPEKVWLALTSAEFTRQYFFGRSIESDWKVGSPWRLIKPDSTSDVTGKVRECDPPRKLLITWKVEGSAEFKNLPECLVSYEIESVGDSTVRLTMTEAHPMPIPAYLLEGGRSGWPMILSGLKSLLETGKALSIPVPLPPKKG